MANWKKIIFAGRRQLAKTIKEAWEQAQCAANTSWRGYVLEISIWDDGTNYSQWELMASSEQKRRACNWGDTDDAKLLTVLRIADLLKRPQFTDEEIKAMIDKWLKKFSRKAA
jgi:hypothetical protein